jgi:hypothetical protein
VVDSPSVGEQAAASRQAAATIPVIKIFFMALVVFLVSEGESFFGA